jgi:hypothetical protein
VPGDYTEAELAEAQELIDQTEREMDTSYRTKGLASILSPVGVTGQTDTEAYAQRSAQYQRERAAEEAKNPTGSTVDPDQLESIRRTHPLLAMLIEDQQRMAMGEGALINRAADPKNRAYSALEEWEIANADIRVLAPGLWMERRNILREALGIPVER